MSHVHIHFKVAYLTEWGQRLYLRTRCDGGNTFNEGCEMRCRWEGTRLVWETAFALAAVTSLEYKYVVVGEAGNEEKSENITRTMTLVDQCFQSGDRIEVCDTWQDQSSPYALFSSNTFRRAIGFPKRKLPDREATVDRCMPEQGQIIARFVVRDWICHSEDRQQVFVSGGLSALGNWQQEKVYELTQVEETVWEGEVLVDYRAFPFTYKYAISNDKGLVLESGESRLASFRSENDVTSLPAMVVLEDGHFRHEKLWKGAGIAAPVFSLRSKKSLGVGEFSDLKLLVDLCAEIGCDIVQILPVNDTSVHRMWWDSYPYSSLSVFALHPIYLRIEDLLLEIPTELQKRIDQARTDLDHAELDYEATFQTKMHLAEEIYRTYGSETFKSDAYMAFFEANVEWLAPYAAFLFLRELFDTPEHWKWGSLAHPSAEDVTRIVSPSYSRYFIGIGFTYWIQFHLHQQLHSVKLYAEQHGIALKGDLPIGVDKCSVDTWMYPSLFRMDKSTGAPPDDFDINGQNWGFPTYNWEAMEKEDYSWWRRRLRKMSEYFHAYRIDHILGFFRIWEIPETSTTATLGYFRPAHPIGRRELEEKGIWDIDRLCEPYVTLPWLQELFGDLVDEVRTRYFSEDDSHRFHLRQPYDTENGILKFKARCNHGWLEKEIQVITNGLMKCVQNVILIRQAPDSDFFYPRFDLMSTESYSGLYAYWQQELRQIHDDYYYQRHNALWKSHAMKTLPAMVRASDMLICGEDLGMIPSCVHPVMQELGLIGMRIQRMPTEGEFGDPLGYPYLTVCCAACHDVTTIRAWWEDDYERAQRFYSEIIHGDGVAPRKCTTDIVRRIIQQHFQSPSVLAIMQIQDLFGLSELYNRRPPTEESINDPTNQRHYWRYRMHVDLETMIADDELAEQVRNMLRLGNRGKGNWMGKRCWIRSNGSRKILTNYADSSNTI